MAVKRLSTGLRGLDAILGGGLEGGTVTQVFGEPGSGKTNLCLQAALQCARRDLRVLFLDTEGFSPERFQQMSHPDTEKLARLIMVYGADSFVGQWAALEEMERLAREKVGLLLWDSAAFYYRVELDEHREMELKRELSRQLARFLEVARKHDLPALFTNQVYADLDRGEGVRPLGGNVVEHLSKAILQLEKTGAPGRRRATLHKHRSMPEGATCEFQITQRGLEDIPTTPPSGESETARAREKP
ncbi:MAG: DNA repair and recombination protein RadB [Euryarchaeota archaeon]|nr:DNA repair and recombination protein RadB [Euryarchaeota archaeon]